MITELMSAFPLCYLLPGVHWWGLSVISTLPSFHIVFHVVLPNLGARKEELGGYKGVEARFGISAVYSC